ncbi:3-mercaptopyruvate sulfurtransferase [Aquicella siphonis]|uniref:3-mercaptopyruvate sulfurtransferase n=1 Tax=Aquicella siphonis TaxID=254247 RepID=A0A5E4PJX3_9COXI|nr:rhodanese-like domain-containing protein [Aquicella siphonis]VVC76778.1 3-mercaptopyruvate sulfurtransferase [Aquicella siphonis]
MVWLINASQLDKFRKSQKNVTILDASWHLPADNRHAREEFLSSHISGARFFDIADFNDQDTSLPNMLTRNESAISEKIGALGITNEHKVIFYDRSSLHTSCRALWMFKTFGHNPGQLYILDGGYAAWEKYGGKIDSGEPRNVSAKPYAVNFEAHNIRSLVQMKNNLHHPSEQVVDVRHPVRYAGGQEIRIGLRSGHIPNSFCFPYFTMFETDGRWKPVEKIRKQLTGVGVDLNYPITTLCGSGITASILNFALDLMNHEQHALYDGSWTEWGWDQLYSGETSLEERPVETSLDT